MLTDLFCDLITTNPTCSFCMNQRPGKSLALPAFKASKEKISPSCAHVLRKTLNLVISNRFLETSKKCTNLLTRTDPLF